MIVRLALLVLAVALLVVLALRILDNSTQCVEATGDCGTADTR